MRTYLCWDSTIEETEEDTVVSQFFKVVDREESEKGDRRGRKKPRKTNATARDPRNPRSQRKRAKKITRRDRGRLHLQATPIRRRLNHQVPQNLPAKSRRRHGCEEAIQCYACMCVIEYIEPGQDPKKKKKKVKKNKVDKKENKETPKQAAAREKKEAEKAKKEAEKKQKEEEWKELAKGKQAVSWSPLPDADFIYDIIS